MQSGLEKNSVEDAIKIIHSFDAEKQAKVGRECNLEPTDEQLVRLLTQYPDSRLSKLMRECSFVPRNDDCVQMLANLEPGCRNTILSRVTWEPNLPWLIGQVEKLNRDEMESMAEIISSRVCLPNEAVINTLRQLAPDSVGQVLKQVGLSLPVYEISKNLKRLTPDEASCAIQRAKIEKLSLETVTAGLKLMRADVAKRAVTESGQAIIDDEEVTDYLKRQSEMQQMTLVKAAGVKMIRPIEEEIESVINSWSSSQQSSLLRRLGWYHNVEFMVNALKNMDYSKQLQVLEEVDVKPKLTIPITEEYLLSLQPKILEDLMERINYLPSKSRIIAAMEELDETNQRLIVKKIDYVPPQQDIIEALQQMTPAVAKETVEIAQVQPRPTPELITEELVNYPEQKRNNLLDGADILPSNEAITKRLKMLNYDEQRQLFQAGNIKIPINRDDIIGYFAQESESDVRTVLKLIGPGALNDEVVSNYLKSLSKTALDQLILTADLEVIVKDDAHVKEYLLSLDVIKQKKIVESLECFTEYDEIVKLVKSISPDHKRTLAKDCGLPVQPDVDEMVTFYFELSTMKRKDFIKEIGYIPNASELAELLRSYDTTAIAQAILSAGLVLPRSIFGPIRTADEVVKMLEDSPHAVIDHGLRQIEFRADVELTSSSLKDMSQEDFHKAVNGSGKCLSLGVNELRSGMAALNCSDVGSVVSGVVPGGGVDSEMSIMLLKRMNHNDQMRVIAQSGAAAIESSDCAVGKYLSSIEAARVGHILKSNGLGANTFETVLDFVRSMDNTTFTRLVRESGLTPELDVDTIVRCAMHVGNEACRKLFSTFGFVPNREDIICILKEIEPHLRSEIVMDSDFCPDVTQIVKLSEGLSCDDRRQAIEMLRGSYEVTQDDILCSMKKLKSDSITQLLKEIGYTADIDGVAQGLKYLPFEHQNSAILEGAGDVAKFVEENNLAEAMKRLRVDQVRRALKVAKLDADVITNELLHNFLSKMGASELAGFILSRGLTESIVSDVLRGCSQDVVVRILKCAGFFPFDADVMAQSFQNMLEASQAQFFSNIMIADASVLNGFSKYPLSFKRNLIMSIDYLPNPDDLARFMRHHNQDAKREIINAIDYQPTGADIVYAFRSTPPRDVSNMLHSAGVELYPHEEDCVRAFKDQGNEFANRVMNGSFSLCDKETLERGLLALNPMEQQQVICCVGIQPPLSEPLLLETLKVLRPDECKRALRQAGFTFDSEEELTELMMKKTWPQQEEILKKAGANFVPLTERGMSDGLCTFTQDKLRQVLSMINKYPPPYADSLVGFKALTIDKQRQFLAESGSRALPTDEQMLEGFQAIRTKGDFLSKAGYVPSKTEFIDLLSCADQAMRREVMISTAVPYTAGDVSKFLKSLVPQEAEAAIVASGVIALPNEEMLVKSLSRHAESVISRVFKEVGYTPDTEDVIRGLQASNYLEIERIFRLANIKRPVDEDVIIEGLRTLRPDECQRAIKSADIGNPTAKDIIDSLKSMSDYEQQQIVKSSGLQVIPATESAVAEYLKSKLKAKQRQILKAIDFPGYLDLIEIVKDLDLSKQWQLIEDANIDYFQHLIQDAEKLQVILVEGLKQCASMQQAHVIKHSCDRLPSELVQYYLAMVAPDERKKIYREIGPYPNDHSSLCELVQIVNCMSPKDRHNFLEMVVCDDLPNDIMKKTFKSKRPTEMQELICELELMLEPYGPLMRKDHEKMRCCVIEFLKCISDIDTKEILKLADKCIVTLLSVPPKECIPVEPVTKLLDSMPRADAVEAIAKTDLQLRAQIMRCLLADVAVRKIMNYPSLEELAIEILDLKPKDLAALIKRVMNDIPFEQILPDDILLKCLMGLPETRRYPLVSVSCGEQVLCPFQMPSQELFSYMIGQLPTNTVIEVLLRSGNVELADLCTGLTISKAIEFLRKLTVHDLGKVHDEVWCKNGSCIQVDSSAMMRETEIRIRDMLSREVEEFKQCVHNEFALRESEIRSQHEASIVSMQQEIATFLKSECCRMAERIVRNLIDGMHTLALCSNQDFAAKLSSEETKELKTKQICDEVINGATRQCITVVTQGLSDLINEYCAKLKDAICIKKGSTSARNEASAATPRGTGSCMCNASLNGTCGTMSCGNSCGGIAPMFQLSSNLNRLMSKVDEMASGCRVRNNRCGVGGGCRKRCRTPCH
ncbi:uncharacterized protein LOC142336718 isoform X2 [Convolutriloba macropyga]|uniref:uncharacterized protein LOC142336718 isoform X2 n=1 Tax=Convolutriloba macropyga TaxID=536237 RepID=UPI003F51B70F